MVDLLDNRADLTWRNFSVPWYDPAMDPNTEFGAQYVRKNLEAQIIPADAMILLEDVYCVKSARKWIDMEIMFAKRHDIPIIAVTGNPPSGGIEDGIADKIVPWNGNEIIETFVQLLDFKRKID